MSRDALRVFRAASWSSEEELESLVQRLLDRERDRRPSASEAKSVALRLLASSRRQPD